MCARVRGTNHISRKQGKDMSEPLQIGTPLPEMEVKTADNHRTTVQAHLGSMQTLIYFLHGTWCPECIGHFHLLQRYLPRIKETSAELVTVTGEESDTLWAFLQSTQPPLEYTVLADSKRSASHAIQAGDDTIAIIVDNQGVVRWFDRWAGHQDEPGYGIILQALRDVQDAEERNHD
jgi:peroxiredoxin